MPAELDPASRRWVEHLRLDHPRRDQAVDDLHAVLARVAQSELPRRRHELGSISGPEFDALAQQAAGDALVSVLDKLDQFPPTKSRGTRTGDVSIALHEVPIDVVAVKLGTGRNAVYMSLFDARRRLRALRTRDATEPRGT